MRSENIQYIPAIDHLRGFAALLIVVYHSFTLITYQLIYAKPFRFDHWMSASNPLTALLIEGHTAVSLFMVLSGFIFTVGLYKKNIEYRGFIFNRFLRTYPLFLFFLLLGVIASGESVDWRALLQTLLFLGNYQGAFNGGSYTAMFWAVAVEWQFYLLFPFIMFLVNRKGFWAIGLGIGAVLATRLFGLAIGGDFFQLNYWTLIGRLDQFIIGIAAGVVYRDYIQANFRWDCIGVVAFVSMCLALYFFNQLGGWPAVMDARAYWPFIEAALWATFILGYVSLSRHWPHKVNKVLSNLGVISYSIYLSHFVLIEWTINHSWFVNFETSRPLVNGILTSILFVIPLTLLVSFCLYNLIEKPFLRRRKKYTHTIEDL